MKKEEQIAETYLNQLALGTVKYEPDGNIPPDFSIHSTIGVEVRRLNENYFGGNRPQGLEELSIPLDKSFEKVLASYDSQFDGASYWVGIMYDRPLPGGAKGTIQDMRQALDAFLASSKTTPVELKVNSKVWFTLHPSHPVQGRVFRPAIYSDNDSGGMVTQLYVQNISHCIQEKVLKVSPYLHRYEEWWLLLIDTIGAWQLEPDEIQQIRNGVTGIGCFQKLLVIDYSGKVCLLNV